MTNDETYAVEFARRLATLVEDYAPYLDFDEMAGCLESELAKSGGYVEYELTTEDAQAAVG